MKIIIHFDGACSTSRGIAAGAAVAYDEAGNELAYRAKFLRSVTTPIAEYTALITGLQLAAALKATEVVAMGDAELIVYHVTGEYRCRKELLQFYLALVHSYMRMFEACEVKLFPKAGPKNKRRYGNARADELAGNCVDEGCDLSFIEARWAA